MEPYDFGKRLQELRAERGYSQSTVAKLLKLTKQAISGYENNTSTPSVESLVNLALLYHVSTDYLLGLENRKKLYIDELDDNCLSHLLKILDIISDNFVPK